MKEKTKKISQKRKGTDWSKLKVEYITTPISLRDLASKHKIRPAGLMARSAKEKWEAERKQYQSELSRTALSESLPDRAEQLSKFNEEDLRIARGLKAMIINQMSASKGNMEPSHIKALSGAAAEAQRIGRLALGAETENSIVTNRPLPSSIDEFV